MKQLSLIKYLLPFLFSFFHGLNQYAFSKDTLDNVVIEDLSNQWLIYDEEYKAYFPYLRTNKKIHSANLLFDANKYREYFLNFVAEEGMSLFIDKKLYYKNISPNKEFVRLRINDLIENRSVEQVLLTIYNKTGVLPLENFYIGSNIMELGNFNSFDHFKIMLQRELDNKRDVMTMSFLFILFLIVILKIRYPKRFFEFSAFNNVIPSFDENIISSFFNMPVLLTVLINSFSMSLIIYIVYYNMVDSVETEWLNIFYFYPWAGVLLLSGFFLLIFLIKYIYVQFVGWIYGMGEFIKVHFHELLKVTLKSNLLLVISTVIISLSGYFQINLNLKLFFSILFIFLLIVLLRVAFLTFRLTGFRNIYLFSYLCTTEILPLIIIIKITLF